MVKVRFSLNQSRSLPNISLPGTKILRHLFCHSSDVPSHPHAPLPQYGRTRPRDHRLESHLGPLLLFSLQHLPLCRSPHLQLFQVSGRLQRCTPRPPRRSHPRTVPQRMPGSRAPYGTRHEYVPRQLLYRVVLCLRRTVPYGHSLMLAPALQGSCT